MERKLLVFTRGEAAPREGSWLLTPKTEKIRPMEVIQYESANAVPPFVGDNRFFFRMLRKGRSPLKSTKTSTCRSYGPMKRLTTLDDAGPFGRFIRSRGRHQQGAEVFALTPSTEKLIYGPHPLEEEIDGQLELELFRERF